MSILVLIAILCTFYWVSPSATLGLGDLESSNVIAYEDMYESSRRCVWGQPDDAVEPGSMEIYWINLKESTERREKMERHLDKLRPRYRHQRFDAVRMDQILLPTDVEATWSNPKDALFTSLTNYIETLQEESTRGSLRYVVSGLLGRKKRNRLKELGCTMSHLLAIHRAVHSTTSSSKYALILEDDVQIPFNVNFAELARSAPEDFAILQLFNSCEGTMEMTWNYYARNRRLWTERKPMMAVDFWSTCAYLINREAIRPAIDAIVKELFQPNSGLFDVKIFAGLYSPCAPINSSCCPPGATLTTYNPPCIYAPRGFQADSYLYAIAKTYVISIPLITNGYGGNRSTFHQDHVLSIHENAFNRQRQYINTLLSGALPLPDFVKRACPEKLRLPMMEKVDRRCHWGGTRSSKFSVTWIDYSSNPLSSSSAPLTGKEVNVTSASYLHYSDVFGTPQDHLESGKLRRFRGLNPSKLIIPSDVLNEAYKMSCRLAPANPIDSSSSSVLKDSNSSLNSTSDVKVMVSGLCGRGRGRDNLNKLAHTVSHFIAAYEAVQYGLESSTPYAIVLEDDVQFPYAIDLDAVVASLPEDFDIFFLTLGDGSRLKQLSSRFEVNANLKADQLWIRSGETDHLSSWSTTAYIINVKRFQSIIEALVSKRSLSRSYDIKVIAVHSNNRKSCFPSSCCTNGVVKRKLPCISSRHGYSYPLMLDGIAGLQKYSSRIPLVVNGIKGSFSPHYKSWRFDSGDLPGLLAQRRVVNAVLSSEKSFPTFFSPACHFGVENSVS